MSAIQVTACQPGIYVKNLSQLHHLPSKPCVLPMNVSALSRNPLSLRVKSSFFLQCVPISKSRQSLLLCSGGGKGMMENDNEGSPWKALEKVMDKFKGQSVEDILRRQIEKGEYYDNNGGGGGSKPPTGGGGGGGPSEPEEESSAEMLDETLQVIWATFGFMFVYIYILTGPELTKLARDYIKYLFSGNSSNRLRNAMYQWGEFYQSMTVKQVKDKYWLEKAILSTETWWDTPELYRDVVRNYLRSTSDKYRSYEESTSDDYSNYMESTSDDYNNYVGSTYDDSVDYPESTYDDSRDYPEYPESTSDE